MDPSGSNSSHSAYSLILQLLQFLNNPLFHQIQNTVKLTFCLQSHTATTTALLTQVSIQVSGFCQQKPFSSCSRILMCEISFKEGVYINEFFTDLLSNSLILRIFQKKKHYLLRKKTVRKTTFVSIFKDFYPWKFFIMLEVIPENPCLQRNFLELHPCH